MAIDEICHFLRFITFANADAFKQEIIPAMAAHCRDVFWANIFIECLGAPDSFVAVFGYGEIVDVADCMLFVANEYDRIWVDFEDRFLFVDIPKVLFGIVVLIEADDVCANTLREVVTFDDV